MANKITYTDKVGITEPGIAENQWRDLDANEIKNKHNLNDDRITNIEDNQVTGVVQYSTFAELPGTGTLNVSYKVTNDPDTSLNGYWHWDGAAYVKDASLIIGAIEEGDNDAVSGDTANRRIYPIESSFVRSKNLVDFDTFVNFIPNYNGTDYLDEGQSAIIPVDDTKSYMVVRDTLPIDLPYTTDEYKILAANFTDGDNGTGNRIPIDPSDLVAFTQCLNSGKITVPIGAKSLIIAAQTSVIDIRNNLSVFESADNFASTVEPKFITEDLNFVYADLDIYNDIKVGSTGVANYNLLCRTQRIYVKDKSYVKIKAGITSTLFGNIVSMYDDSGANIGNVSLLNGSINLDDFCITLPIIEGDYCYVTIDTRGISNLAVASFTNLGTYVLPEVQFEYFEQPFDIKTDKVIYANVPIAGEGNQRVYHDFYTFTNSGKKIRHRVTSLGITSDTYGFGSSLIDSAIMEENIFKNEILINTPNIAEYYSFRSIYDGVPDTNFTGHAESLELVDIKIYADGLELNLSSGIDVQEASVFEVVQNIKLKHYSAGFPHIANGELRFIIYPNGEYRHTNKVDFIVDNIDLTTMYVAMQFVRNSAKSSTITGFDKIAYQNDAILQDVGLTGTRQFYENANDRSLVLIDSDKDLRVEINMQAWESTHPSTTNDKLSLHSETAFSKLYYYFGLGLRNTGDNYMTDCINKYY